MIARWTGTVRAGQTCRTPVHAVDLLPTLLQLGRARVPDGHAVDGVSLVPLLHGRRLAARSLYWYQPFYDIRWLATPSAVVREGDYKLLEFFGDTLEESPTGAEYRTAGRVELYDLSQDIGERRDLARAKPDKAAALRSKLHAWIKSTGSPLPGRNPRYNPLVPLAEVRGMPPSS